MLSPMIHEEYFFYTKHAPRKCRSLPLPLLMLGIIRAVTTHHQHQLLSQLSPQTSSEEHKKTYQMIKTLPFLRTGLHPSHNLFTEDRVFMPRCCIEVLKYVEFLPWLRLNDGLEKFLARDVNVGTVIDREVRDLDSIWEYVGSVRSCGRRHEGRKYRRSCIVAEVTSRRRSR